jgi:hypothetical protein
MSNCHVIFEYYLIKPMRLRKNTQSEYYPVFEAYPTAI